MLKSVLYNSSFPGWLQQHPDVATLLRQTVDAVAALQQPNGNFPCAMDEVTAAGSGGGRPQEDELVHWCHGAPGNNTLTCVAC